MENKLRSVEILKKHGWEKVKFDDIIKGDTFRLFEPDGAIVLDKIGRTEFIATSDVYVDPNAEALTVNIED